jgi:hypothetical protein
MIRRAMPREPRPLWPIRKQDKVHTCALEQRQIGTSGASVQRDLVLRPVETVKDGRDVAHDSLPCQFRRIARLEKAAGMKTNT